MTKDPKHMTDSELADWQYAHRDELESAAGDAEVIEIPPGPRTTTISLRLPLDEAARITKAAEGAGVSRSEWIRNACARAVGEAKHTGEPESDWRALLEQIAMVRAETDHSLALMTLNALLGTSERLPPKLEFWSTTLERGSKIPEDRAREILDEAEKFAKSA